MSALVVDVSDGTLLKELFASCIRNDSCCVIWLDIVMVAWPPGLASVVTVLTSSMFVWAPPICSIRVVACDTDVSCVDTECPSSNPPPSPRLEVLNIIFMSILSSGSLSSSESMSSRFPSYSSSIGVPFAIAFAVAAGEVDVQNPSNVSVSLSSSSWLTWPVTWQTE